MPDQTTKRRRIVPGWRELRLTTLVLDVNGTLALDGELLPDMDGWLRALRAKLDVHPALRGHLRPA